MHVQRPTTLHHRPAAFTLLAATLLTLAGPVGAAHADTVAPGPPHHLGPGGGASAPGVPAAPAAPAPGTPVHTLPPRPIPVQMFRVPRVDLAPGDDRTSTLDRTSAVGHAPGSARTGYAFQDDRRTWRPTAPSRVAGQGRMSEAFSRHVRHHHFSRMPMWGG